MILFTIQTALAATALLLLPGIAVSWLLARRKWPGKALFETLVMLPLVLPPVATGLVLLRLFGREGAVGSWLHHSLGIDVVFTWRGVVLAMSVMAFPLFVRSTRTAFEQVARRYEDVARTLGASEARVFTTVTLPLARRGIAGGAILAFARALGEFGATVLVAGNIPGRTSTIAVSIYNDIQLGRDDDALRLMIVSAILAFAALWTSERLLRPG